MAEINELILEKLREKPEAVAKVAVEAVRAAARLPKPAVEQHLHDFLRRVVREKENAR